ncbi:MAG: hypothetical protein AABW99_04105 [archaeon]
MPPKIFPLVFCSLIVLALIFSGCLAKPTNTIQVCEDANSSALRDQCYFDHALQDNKLGNCTQIIDPDLRNSCINSFP